ncbi:hypothetical protein R5R35_006281 [Gryllus longicercus]|uniref:Uncharacterized protein n=1 Tax=Gryllus longicercus TaxID=2509291 RepID=A0AAN9ZA73_9ORTH
MDCYATTPTRERPPHPGSLRPREDSEDAGRALRPPPSLPSSSSPDRCLRFTTRLTSTTHPNTHALACPGCAAQHGTAQHGTARHGTKHCKLLRRAVALLEAAQRYPSGAEGRGVGTNMSTSKSNYISLPP